MGFGCEGGCFLGWGMSLGFWEGGWFWEFWVGGRVFWADAPEGAVVLGPKNRALF